MTTVQKDKPPAGDSAGHEQDHFFSAAKVVAGLTMVSRVLGMFRDAVLIPLGVPAVADTFWTAFGIPHMFRRLFGEGALSAAFVPVFTETAEAGGWQRAKAVLANVSGLLAALLAILVALLELGLAAWLQYGDLGPAEQAAKQQLTIQFTMIMLPFSVFICLLALSSSALNARGHFAYPAAAPILLNLGLIAAAVLIAPATADTDEAQFRVVGIVLVAASVVQLVGALLLLHRHGLLGLWQLWPIRPEVRQIARRMLPTVLPLGLVQIGDQLMRIIALALTRTDAAPHLPLVAGVVRAQYAAGRLYQLPLGVLAVSVATAVFPLMSRFAARGDLAGLRDAVNRALRLCLFLSIPAGAGLILIAHPTIVTIFQRGDFTAADSARTAVMLQMYCLGLPAYFVSHILLRAFFSRKDTTTPMYAAVACTALSLVLMVAGVYTPLRSAALGLATAVAAIVNVSWLLWALHNRIGRLGIRSIFASALRTVLATAAMAAAAYAAQWAVRSVTATWPAEGKSALIAELAATLLAGAAAFLATARLLGCAELGELRRRKGRKADDPKAPGQEPPDKPSS